MLCLSCLWPSISVRTERRLNRVSISGGVRDFSVPQSVQALCEPREACCSVGTRGCSPGGKATRVWSWLLTAVCRCHREVIPTCVSRGGAAGWGTALQAGRLRVRFAILLLEFFIDNPSRHTVALELTQPVTEWGGGEGKGVRCVGLTLPPSYTDCLEICEP